MLSFTYDSHFRGLHYCSHWAVSVWRNLCLLTDRRGSQHRHDRTSDQWGAPHTGECSHLFPMVMLGWNLVGKIKNLHPSSIWSYFSVFTAWFAGIVILMIQFNENIGDRQLFGFFCFFVLSQQVLLLILPLSLWGGEKKTVRLSAFLYSRK